VWRCTLCPAMVVAVDRPWYGVGRDGHRHDYIQTTLDPAIVQPVQLPPRHPKPPPAAAAYLRDMLAPDAEQPSLCEDVRAESIEEGD
jgi:hypothetical protein